MYATDVRQTSDAHHRFMPPRRGRNKMLRVRVQLRYQKCLDAHARSVVQLKHQTAVEAERESKVCTLVEDSSTASVYSPYIHQRS